MSMITSLFTLLLTALVLENALFSRALDATAMLVVSYNRREGWFFRGILVGVTTLSAAFACLLSGLIAKLPMVQYLRPVIYLLILAVLYGVTCLVLYFWKWRSWLESNLSMINLAFFNSAAYGAMVLSVYSGLTFGTGVIYGLGVGLSYLLAEAVLLQGRKALAVCNLPKSFRGLPAELVYVGIIALSLYGLVGHQLAS